MRRARRGSRVGENIREKRKREKKYTVRGGRPRSVDDSLVLKMPLYTLFL